MERLRRIRHVALDMDGTIYMGMSLFPLHAGLPARTQGTGIGYSFLTNNPSKSIADYLHKLDTLGIRASRDEMDTTALATIDYIKTHHPAAKRLFLLGTPSMISEFRGCGLRVVRRLGQRRARRDRGGVRHDAALRTALPRGLVDQTRGALISPPTPTGCAPPISRPYWSTAARSAPASNTPRDAAPTSRWASPTRTCFRASSRATGCSPTRSPWSATASTPTSRWPTTPGRWACWCSRAKRRSTWPTRPTRSPNHGRQHRSAGRTDPRSARITTAGTPRPDVPPPIRRPERGKQKRLISYDNSAIGKYRIIIGVGL